jgi:hypothetical protein
MTAKQKTAAGILAALVMLCIIIPVTASTALGANSSGEAIGFEDDAPLQVTWDDPLEFVVLNNTTLDLQVQMSVGEFVSEHQSTNSAGSVNLVQVPDAVFTLPATSRKPLSIAINQNAQPDPGKYNGWITLSTGQPPTVIRKSVQLSVPITQVEGLKSEQTTFGSVPPAVDAWTLQAYRLLPGMRPVCFRNLSFTCTLPVKVQNPPALARAGFIGTLNGDKGGGLTVSFKQPRQNHAVLALDFTKLWTPVGAYSGILDFLPGDETAGNVTLTVNVKDTFVTPLIVVGLGILLAQWAQFYLTVRRGVMEVQRRLAQVTVDYEAMPSEVINGYTIKTDVAVQRDAVTKALDDWSNRRLIKPAEEDTARYTVAVLEPLEKLETGIRDWVSFDELLQKLRVALDEKAWPVIEKTKPPAHLNLDTPRFYIVAQALLRGRAISLRDFSQRQEVIRDAIEFAEFWGELEAVRATEAEALDFISQYKHQLSDKAKVDLELARRKLSEVHRELWEAGNLTRLRVLRTPEDLEEAKTLLNQLMGLIEVGPSKAEDTAVEGAGLVGPWSAEAGAFLGSFEMSVLRYLRARLWAIVPPSIKRVAPESAEAARRRIVWLDRSLLAGDLALVVGAYLAAIVAGLKPYFTTNFGTLYDYLSAFTWGFGAKAAVEFVNAVIEKFFGDSS